MEFKGTKPLVVMGGEKAWSLIKAVPENYSEQSSNRFSDALNTINQLKALKFKFYGYSQPLQYLSDRFVLWEQADNPMVRIYLIDLKPPVYVFFLCEIGSSSVDTSLMKFSDDVCGFDLEDVISNGNQAGQQETKTIIVNFENRTYQEKQMDNWTDSKDKNEQFIVDRENVGYGINWCWIYKWDGNNWINDSANHPDFYKTVVLNELQSDFKIETKKSVPALAALIDAAKKGGPAALGK